MWRSLGLITLVCVLLYGCGEDQAFLVIDGCEIRPGTSCRGANLSGQNLAGQNLSNAILANANLSDCDLRGVDFRDADLTAANFRNAQLQDANFTGARIVDADFEGANTRCARGLEDPGTGCEMCADEFVCRDGECVLPDDGPPPDACGQINDDCDGIPCCDDLNCNFNLCEPAFPCDSDIECPPDNVCIGGKCRSQMP